MAKEDRSAEGQKTGAQRRQDEDRLSHVDAAGRIRMVDVGGKPATAREAVARGRITCLPRR